MRCKECFSWSILFELVVVVVVLLLPMIEDFMFETYSFSFPIVNLPLNVIIY